MISGITGNSKSNQLYDIIKSYIKKMGGMIVNGPPFPRYGGKQLEEIFVPPVIMIAPNCLRTIKYLDALGLMIPCLHYNWIIHCYENNILYSLEHYQLPAGITFERDRISQKKKVFSTYPHPVKFRTFYLRKKYSSVRIEICGDTNFVSAWADVIRTAGGRAVNRLFTQHEKHIEVT